MPPEEEARLAAIPLYDLAAASERTLETLCRLAATICDTECSGVSIVHEDQLSFAATNEFERESMVREHAPCAHTVCTPDQVTVVEDTLEDPRTRESRYVIDEPGVRFYAGAPLTTPDGHALGTIWAMGTTPQELSAEQREGLGMLAQLAMEHLDRHRDPSETRQEEAASQPVDHPGRRLDEFAGAISHELRNVLSHVVSNLDLLDQQIGDELEGEPRELLDEAREGGQRLSEVIEDLLRFAQTEQGDPVTEAVNVDCVLDDLAVELAAEIEAADANIEAGPMPEVDGQSGMVRLLFKNLLLNALRYRGEEPARIEVTAEETPDGMVRFEVADDGVGIPKDEQGRLFEMFYRASNTSSVEGTGIGLALVARIVEAHGGEIGVDSTPGSGSTFWFTLPAA